MIDAERTIQAARKEGKEYSAETFSIKNDAMKYFERVTIVPFTIRCLF